MWDALQDMAQHYEITIDDLVTHIDKLRDRRYGLSSAIRVYIVEFYRAQRRGD
jgi:predicted DNA-binding ribbon-helix-helix protein